jgi:hypothetical protein
MFVVEGQQAEAEIRDQGEVDSVVSRLRAAGYRPVLRTMLDAASDVASLTQGTIPVTALLRGQAAFRRPDATPVPAGDLFFSDQAAFVLQPMGSRLHCWEIRHHGSAPQLTPFCAAVEQAAREGLDGRRVRGMDFTWKPIKERQTRRSPIRGRFYQETKLETKPADHSPEEALASGLLVVGDSRSFLIRLAQVGKARSIDAAGETEAALAKPLLDHGLIRKEYLVLCRQDSHTICALQDRTEIDTGRAGTFTCTICGRPFRDELVQDIFALTDLGKRLMTGSRWMTIWVTELLVEAGIPKDQIAWNAVAGEDELDIMTDALGSRVFFELKDRQFGLGDAYPFAYRVTRYGGTFGVVASTEHVAEEAKKFFMEQRPAMGVRIDTLEGADGIAGGISSLVDRVSRTGVQQLLLEIGEPLGMDLVPIVTAWMGRAAGGGPERPG